MEEIDISSDEAKRKHGITSRHSRMPNGELRFRLLKADGTAYIRTEASLDSGWQRSHYHNQVKETYIVQAGWMGYAQLVDDNPTYHIYKKGESFTTRPWIIHNVYLPSGAVVHTVKHGESKNEKRLEDDRTSSFTEITQSISEKDLKKMARANNSSYELAENLKDYNEAYRHFDNLIWQVPAWSTGIFAAVLAGTSRLSDTNSIAKLTSLSTETLLSGFYGLVGIFILALSYSLYRFRWHQIRAKNYTPKWHLRSPQVGLQLIVNTQAIILLLLSASSVALPLVFKIGIAVLIFGLLMVYQEIVLFKQGRIGNKPESVRS